MVAENQSSEASSSSSSSRSSSPVSKKIIILTGAGISTSAGIPDFRSPETGLYHNLQALNLPFPEAVFELGYFKRNPVPFWTLAKELYPGKHFPTPAHYFFPLLAKHDVLLRVFSQNIDTLETLAGLEREQIVEAHGSFASSHCLSCGKEASGEYVVRSGVRHGQVVKCDEDAGKGKKGKCGGLVKPDIVFFGEGLPKRFFDRLKDLDECDLLIVIGTSLQVQPFASLVERVGDHVPRLLINREPVGPFEKIPSSRSSGLSTSLAEILKRGGTSKTQAHGHGRDFFWQGDADDGVRRLAQELGWEDELEKAIEQGRQGLETLWKSATETVKEDRAVAATKSDEVGKAGEVASIGEQGREAAKAKASKGGEEVGGGDEAGKLEEALDKQLNL
ncbi:DHS-like NAD/FAD-binding domain-containing protein [Naematelia encephala]|uniref:NAD-dependent protein deacetylase n=1 Tax=Naematelia encephala TaxID=71784 RepID=A0A1Y2B9U1_9TREE|nr:DHS-like NAD/FAD-binding domain-containing protein [Naematelia encephala]